MIAAHFFIEEKKTKEMIRHDLLFHFVYIECIDSVDKNCRLIY